jgi:succinate dehydrogenase hydrophobic anchor subunit
MKNFFRKLGRVGFDVLALLTIILLMFFIPNDFLPVEAKVGLVSIFVTKFILVSAAVIHAHITRKLLFPYIDFSHEEDLSNNLMIIAWYVIIIFGWTRGG